MHQRKELDCLMATMATDNIVTAKVFWRLNVYKEADLSKPLLTKDVGHFGETPAPLLLICSHAFQGYLRTRWQTVPGAKMPDKSVYVRWDYNPHHNMFSTRFDGIIAIVKFTELKRSMTTWRQHKREITDPVS